MDDLGAKPDDNIGIENTSTDINFVIESLLESKEIEFTVTDPKALHWKPSFAISDAVTNSSCAATLTVSKDGQEYVANADSILELVQLPVQEGDTVTIKIIGEESKKLVTSLLSFAHWHPTQYKEV